MKKQIIATLLLLTTTASNIGCTDDSPAQITSLKLNRTELTLQPGETFQLEATTRPADAGVPIKWSSSNEAVAAVDERGLVTGTGYGAALVTARYGSYSAKCSVTLNAEQVWDPSQALAAPLSSDTVSYTHLTLPTN